MTLQPAGPDYCREHSGIREEDEDVCDFASLDAERDDCDLTPLLYEDGQPA